MNEQEIFEALGAIRQNLEEIDSAKKQVDAVVKAYNVVANGMKDSFEKTKEIASFMAQSIKQTEEESAELRTSASEILETFRVNVEALKSSAEREISETVKATGRNVEEVAEKLFEQQKVALEGFCTQSKKSANVFETIVKELSGNMKNEAQESINDFKDAATKIASQFCDINNETANKYAEWMQKVIEKLNQTTTANKSTLKEYERIKNEVCEKMNESTSLISGTCDIALKSLDKAEGSIKALVQTTNGVSEKLVLIQDKLNSCVNSIDKLSSEVKEIKDQTSGVKGMSIITVLLGIATLGSIVFLCIK